jgi:anti-sigma factor RsiW
MRSCEEYREMISALLDGELPEAERAALEAHIASCAACAETYDAFAALTLPEEEVPATLHAGIMARVAPAQKALRGQRILARTRAWLTAAACLVFVVGTLFAVGRLALPRGAKSDGAAPAAEEPALCAGGTSGPIQEKAETSAAGAVPAEAPMPAPAPAACW